MDSDRISRKKYYEGVQFNITIVTSVRVGVKFPVKMRYVTHECSLESTTCLIGLPICLEPDNSEGTT